MSGLLVILIAPGLLALLSVICNAHHTYTVGEQTAPVNIVSSHRLFLLNPEHQGSGLLSWKSRCFIGERKIFAVPAMGGWRYKSSQLLFRVCAAELLCAPYLFQCKVRQLKQSLCCAGFGLEKHQWAVTMFWLGAVSPANKKPRAKPGNFSHFTGFHSGYLHLPYLHLLSHLMSSSHLAKTKSTTVNFMVQGNRGVELMEG